MFVEGRSRLSKSWRVSDSMRHVELKLGNIKLLLELICFSLCLFGLSINKWTFTLTDYFLHYLVFVWQNLTFLKIELLVLHIGVCLIKNHIFTLKIRALVMSCLIPKSYLMLAILVVHHKVIICKSKCRSLEVRLLIIRSCTMIIIVVWRSFRCWVWRILFCWLNWRSPSNRFIHFRKRATDNSYWLLQVLCWQAWILAGLLFGFGVCTVFRLYISFKWLLNVNSSTLSIICLWNKVAIVSSQQSLLSNIAIFFFHCLLASKPPSLLYLFFSTKIFVNTSSQSFVFFLDCDLMDLLKLG